ncbi:zinc finger protein 862-like [Xenia sp. Carnegie-2017]|uniref:zinc finger protein 862-like n=1 Tax=Xenia sp. Carnegie-2017 TaxID=2897299 RepID=UPI001F034515|nr:zinc finger protein 862-like [Xenia sp. Carnegie-2017]
MAEIDRKVMITRFNTAYYLATSERPYSDSEGIITLNEMNGMIRSSKFRNERAMANITDSIADKLKQKLMSELKKTRYFSLLTDGSTDKGVSEQEVCIPQMRFLAIESPTSTSADGLKKMIQDCFSRFHMNNFPRQLAALNVDGASVNLGSINGLAAKLRKDSPWLLTIHCFNHRLELAVKDAFKGTEFDEVDELLTKLYYLYQKSAKRYRELKGFSEIFERA